MHPTHDYDTHFWSTSQPCKRAGAWASYSHLQSQCFRLRWCPAPLRSPPVLLSSASPPASSWPPPSSPPGWSFHLHRGQTFKKRREWWKWVDNRRKRWFYFGNFSKSKWGKMQINGPNEQLSTISFVGIYPINNTSFTFIYWDAYNLTYVLFRSDISAHVDKEMNLPEPFFPFAVTRRIVSLSLDSPVQRPIGALWVPACQQSLPSSWVPSVQWSLQNPLTRPLWRGQGTGNGKEHQYDQI